MRSIYNERLVPVEPDYRNIEREFREQARAILVKARTLGLNMREVSHDFIHILLNIESEMCLTYSAEMDNREDDRREEEKRKKGKR